MIIFNQPINLPELTAVVGSTFGIPVDKKRRKQTPHRVKVNGKYIVTESKKTIWPSIGAAKNAIRNHIETSDDLKKWIRKLEVQDAINADRGVPLNYRYSKINDEIIQYLEINNIIEYVPYTDGE
jgi:uncharacterized protein with WD repeat